MSPNSTSELTTYQTTQINKQIQSQINKRQSS
jgi:hypothetical protein